MVESRRRSPRMIGNKRDLVGIGIDGAVTLGDNHPRRSRRSGASRIGWANRGNLSRGLGCGVDCRIGVWSRSLTLTK